jgi:putative acetyltransferase
VPVRVRPEEPGDGPAIRVVHDRAFGRPAEGRLVAALQACRALGEPVVFVLGDPPYYPRFGFRPAGPLGLSCEFGAADEAFMVAELSPATLAGRTGRVRYRPEFSSLA